MTSQNLNGINMSFFQKDELSLIMGTLLGDAHLNKRGESFRLKITHSIDQKEYVLWKHKKLERLCQTTQSPKEATDKKGFTTVTFYTSSTLEYKAIHKLFYKLQPSKDKSGKQMEKPVKVITKELIDNLPTDPITLATWFMDDGSVRDDCYAGKIATQGFSKNESHLLCEYLERCGILGAKVVSHVKKKDQYYISLPATGDTFAKFVDYIEPVVQEIPSMVYKLNKARKRETP